MKAIVYEKFGPPEVLQIREIDKPIPKEKEVLIKIHATTVHRGDSRMRSLDLPVPFWQKIMARLFLGIRKPRKKVLGMELAGEIEEIGSQVTNFKIGDKVFASTIKNNFGGYAEYKCMPEDGILSIMPANLTYEEAAVVPNGAFTALGLLKMAKVGEKTNLLVYGASGSVGSFAVQLAKFFGATITGICGSESIEIVKKLGAKEVFDYKKDNLQEIAKQFEVIIDAVGYMPTYLVNKNLFEKGLYLEVHKSSDKIKDKQEDVINELKDLFEKGNLKPIIDKVYPFSEIVQAHRYVDTGHKHGNVVIKVI